MLTDKDREWLEKREGRRLEHDGYFCKYCCHCNYEYDGGFICDIPQFGREDEDLGFCPVHLYEETESYVPKLKSLMDCAEFEAQVSLLLAQKDGAWEPCYHSHCTENADTVADCMACRLKHARLAVEAEMEQEGK